MNAVKNNPVIAAGGSGTVILLALIGALPARVQPYAVIALGVLAGAVAIAIAIERHSPIGAAVAKGVDDVTQAALDSHSKQIQAIARQLQVVDKTVATVAPQVDQLTQNEQKLPSTGELVQAVTAAFEQKVAQAVVGAGAPPQPAAPPAESPQPPAA